MRQLSVEEVKRVQLGILDAVADFCNRNGITFYLCGGTLLGAIRHQGYIPWDDDIDIAMERSQYTRFVDQFNGTNDLYEVRTADNSKGFPYPFAKITHRHTRLVESLIAAQDPIGVSIDLFPIDCMPAGDRQCRRLMRRMRIWRAMLSVKLSRLDQRRPLWKNAILVVAKVLLSPVPRRCILARITRLALSSEDPNSAKVGVIVWGYGEREVVDRTVFRSTILKTYEGRSYPVPIGYHEWLTSVYGDYMTPPPPDQQVTHHSFAAYVD